MTSSPTVTSIDLTDVDLSTLDEARAATTLEIRSIIITELQRTGISELSGRYVEISDEQGRLLDVVQFHDVVAKDGSRLTKRKPPPVRAGIDRLA